MSELKIEEPPKKKKKVKIAQLTLGRCDTGLELYIKAPVIEEFIKKSYGGETLTATSASWCKGEKFYRAKPGIAHPEITASRYTISIGEIEHDWLVNRGENLNMSFLRIAGIKDGKTFKFHGLYRESEIAAIAQSINEGLKNLFQEYSVPSCYEIEVIAED